MTSGTKGSLGKWNAAFGGTTASGRRSPGRSKLMYSVDATSKSVPPDQEREGAARTPIISVRDVLRVDQRRE